MNLAAEDIDDTGVLEEKFGGAFAASHTEFPLHVAHDGLNTRRARVASANSVKYWNVAAGNCLTRIARIIANGISEFVLIREIRVKQFSVPVFEYSVFRG